MNFNLLLQDNSDIFSKNSKMDLKKKSLDKNSFFQKIYPKKELTNLNQEIFSRQKIILKMKKKLDSQIIIKKESEKNLSIPFESQMESNYSPSSKNKAYLRKRKIEKFINTKIKLGAMFLYALRKQRKSVEFKNRKESISSSKNYILSPSKDIINNEYEKSKNNISQKRNFENHLTKNISFNSFCPILNSNIIDNNNNKNYNFKNSVFDISKNNLFNKTYFNNSKGNEISFKNQKKITRNISSFNQTNSSNEESKNNSIYGNNFIEKYNSSPFINKCQNNLMFPDWTARNKKSNYYKNNDRIYNSDSKNNNYISNYTERKNQINYFNHQSSINSNLYHGIITSTNNDIIHYISKNNKNNNNLSDSNKKENNLFFYSVKNKSSNEFLLKNSNKNSISNLFLLKNIKPNKSIFVRAKSQSNYKKYSKQFAKKLNRKVKSLNNITKTCNSELIRLIDVNNKIGEKSVRYKLKEKKEEIKKELDIRKALLDKHSKEGKYKALLDDLRIEITLSNKDNKHIINLLKKKINKISDSIALNMLEKCFRNKKKAIFDINELFKEHINKKIDKQNSKIKEIKKKAENNYQKMVKLRHNLSFHPHI